MATQIEEDIPELPIPPYKNADSGATFVTKAEAFRQALKDVFQPAMNYVINKINIISNEVSANSIIAENSAIIASGLANFQGVWSEIAVYNKGQSVESTTGSKIYYTSKVNNNLNHSVTDTNYWLYNPINDKLDKDFSLLTDKTTPSNTDNLVIQESDGLLKKLSWANIKTALNLLYIGLTGNQSIGGVKTFTSSPVVPTPTTTGNVITMDNIIQKTAVGMGYGTGAGGAVTQATSKSTTVTLNKPTGRITTSNSSLVSGGIVSFQVNCSLVSQNDTVVLTGFTNAYNYKIELNSIANGYFAIRITNITAGSLSEVIDINYTITKGAIS